MLTLMYTNSLTVLARPYPSLPTMLKLSMVVYWPVVVWWPCIGAGALRSSFIFPQMFEQIL